MSEPFIAEIRIFAGNFPPRGWAFCDGQLLPIAQNTALFSLIGTTYGGDGRSTTALPDLQGRLPMHPGRGPGLADRRLGERAGVEAVTLTEQEIPNHGHALRAVSEPGDLADPANRNLARSATGSAYQQNASALVPMNEGMLANAGNNQAHNNLMPYLALYFIIALEGVFPS